jgi:hypothetical protein
MIQKTQRFAGASEEDAKTTHIAGYSRRHWEGFGFVNCCMESTTLNPWCQKRGVQENMFDLWLENYPGRVWVRQLTFDRTETFYMHDGAFWRLNKGKSYESGIPGAIELALCGLGVHKYIPWYKPMASKELHCSELIAKRLKYHGLLQGLVLPHRMPPAMWGSKIDGILGCPASERIYIK